MPLPQLSPAILLNIARLLTNDEGELCFADFNSFVKVSREVYACLNRTLWQEASKSQYMNDRVFTHLIRTNDLACLNFYLELGADVETRLLEFDCRFDNFSEIGDTAATPLKAAVDLDNIPMARLLLEHGADVIQYDGLDHPGHSAIHAARSAEMVELLLDYGADPEHQLANRLRPLHYYAMRGNIEAMQTVLRHGVEVDPAWSDSGMGFLYCTPLYYAARGNIATVKLLLHHGADARKQGYFGATPFHSAATAGQTDVMRLLHEHWPEGTRQGDEDGCTPFHYAAEAGQTNMVRLLLEFWPDGIREKDHKENTPLNSAASDGRTKVVELLLEAWPEGVREKNGFGYTPLRSAASRGETDVVRLLVEHWPEGMKEKIKNGTLCTPGDTPLHSAAAAGHTEVVRLLVEDWPEGMREKNKNGNTPLHSAAGTGKTEVVRLLVESWPEALREKDKYGNTPLHLAAAMGNTEAVRLLVQSWPEGMEAINEDEQTPLLLALEKELWLTLPDSEAKEIFTLLGGVY